MGNVKLEICCYNFESALTAQKYGAHRIELCENAFDGGTTPSYGMMQKVVQQLSIPVFAMIRPRGGDFLFSPEEIEIMLQDIEAAKSCGVKGVVLGALTPNGDLDEQTMSRLIQAALPLEVTLHRAFDLCKEPLRVLHQAKDLGINRILTSGQKPTAPAGIDLIRKLVEAASEDIIIMPGAGLNPENVLDVLQQTGAREIHASARHTRSSKMKYSANSVVMGNEAAPPDQLMVANGKLITALRQIADEL